MEETTSAFSEILAKSNPRQTLDEHTRQCLRCLGKFLQAFDVPLKRVAKLIGASRKELESRLFATVYLHDIGKANCFFQRRIRGGSRNSAEPPHPLISLPFLLGSAPPITVSGSNLSLEALAGFSHHTPFHAALYTDWRSDFGEVVLPEAYDFYRRLPEVHQQFLGRIYPFQLKDPCFRRSDTILGSLMNSLLYAASEIRDVFAVFEGALHYADWLASGGYEDWPYQIEDLKKNVYSDSKFSNGLRSFQENAGRTDGHYIVSAPTGSGKTEAALLWSSRKPSRLIYLLPTRTTSNAMFRRLERYAPGKVGLSHGTAALVLSERFSYNRTLFHTVRLQSAAWMFPATVTTVDQLLLAQFNWLHWEMLEIGQWKSSVVVDEIHCYEPYTLALLLIALEQVINNGGRVCAMSATLPDFMRCRIEQILPGTLTEQIGDLTDPRHRLVLQQGALYDCLDLAIKDAERGKLVLIVANTVDDAVALYRAVEPRFSREQRLLFHSRFIERHRRHREAKLSELKRGTGFIAITTQIVEVSLDLDFDVLYTELAPVDALAQRMGRVNRYGDPKRSPAEIHVYMEPSRKAERVYDEATLGLLSKAKSILREGTVTQDDLLRWVNDQYPAKDWGAKLEEQVAKARGNLSCLRNKLWQIQTVQLNEDQALEAIVRTRPESLPSVEIVPSCFRERVVEDLNRGCSEVRLEYQVRVPVYLAKRRSFDANNGIMWGEVSYDDDYGVT
jgi:CRISPR-associated endonuclease/helicase Cas3